MRHWSVLGLTCCSLAGAAMLGCKESEQSKESKPAEPPDHYAVVLHSSERTELRTALTAILERPNAFVPRIQQSLRDYPKTLRTDWTAANRAVHIAALVRDSSFAPIIAGILGDSAVIDACLYPCPVVFALTVFSAFGGWTPPATLDTSLTPVTDLQSAIRDMPRISLDVRPLDSMTNGPAVERNRKRVEGKNEEDLIRIAEPASADSGGWLAAIVLKGSVTTSKNRIPLYLLLMNESPNDASHEYRSAIYGAIYRAETARARGR